jgi:hypothetical protein
MRETWTAVRRLHLAGSEVPIFDNLAGEAIRAEWAAIVQSAVNHPGRLDQLEGFAVALYSEDGVELEWIQFDTLEIALDQGSSILGVSRGAWEVCRVDVSAEGPTFVGG